MGVTIELQNLGDARLSREIVASVEHALSDKPGEWLQSAPYPIVSSEGFSPPLKRSENLAERLMGCQSARNVGLCPDRAEPYGGQRFAREVSIENSAVWSKLQIQLLDRHNAGK